MSNNKLHSAYGFPFSKSRDIPLNLWDTARKHQSLNGFYVVLPDTTTFSNIGTDINNNVRSWYDLSGSGNYLLQDATSRCPTLAEPSSIFNFKPSISFDSNGSESLYFKYSLHVGTVIIVYNTVSTTTSHPIYAPRTLPNTSPPVYYDMFPRAGSSLWVEDGLSSNFAYNSTSRVNGKEVGPDYTIINNEVRILSVHNLGGTGQTERISGIGGQSRPSGTKVNSVQGSVAAVLTFEDNLDSADILELELALQELYINYTGPALATIPSLKFIDGSSVYYDFAAIAIDEWFDIVQYEVISPLDIGISFGVGNSGILAGQLTELYEGTLVIRITNEVGIFNDFDIPFRSVYKDTIVDSLPLLTNVTGVFSAVSDAGLYDDRWEDARRLNEITLVNQENSVYTVVNYADLNNNNALTSTASTNLLSNTNIVKKTIVWVYVQNSYGIRQLLNNLPDIYGIGALWTIGQPTDVFGNTAATRLNATVNEHPVDVLSYRTPLNEVLIITATSDDTMSYSGFGNIRGYIPFFATWDEVLDNAQLDAVRALLANRFIADTAPLIVDNDLKYNYDTNASIDLTGITVDLHTGNNITYTLVSSTITSSITSNVLTYSAVADTIEQFVIDATNSNNDVTQFTLQVQNILRTNPLYIDIKTYLTQQSKDIEQVYINSTDTISAGLWQEYSLQGSSIALSQVENQAITLYGNLNALYFDAVGGSNGLLSTPTTDTKNLFIVYVSDVTQGTKIDLWADQGATLFGSNQGQLYGDVSANNHYIKINGLVSTRNYNHNPYTLRVISTKLGQGKAIEYLGSLNDSVKGFVCFCMLVEDELTVGQVDYIHQLIVDAYTYTGPSLLLNFNNTIDDLVYSTSSSGTANYNQLQKKFGAASLDLLNSHLFLDNNANYALTTFDFTIQFWIKVTRPVVGTDVLNIFRLSTLHIYISNQQLKVGLNSTTQPLLIGSMATYLDFMHVAVVRVGNTLNLYVNGILQSSVTYLEDISDAVGELQLGQDTNLTQSGSIQAYLDDLAVYARQALYTENFTVPNAELA